MIPSITVPLRQQTSSPKVVIRSKNSCTSWVFYTSESTVAPISSLLTGVDGVGIHAE